jgi:aminoacrylate hydrolase
MGEVEGLYWEEHGSSHGPPLILSAGLGGSGAYWTPNLAALAESHRIILYDHRGTGRSSRALAPDHSQEEMARDVLMLMDALDIGRAILVGHALGAVVALTLALAAPERLAGLVLVNGFARADDHFRNCMSTRLFLLRDSGLLAFVRAQPIFLYPARWIVDNLDRLRAEEDGHMLAFQGRDNLEARIDLLCAFHVLGRLREIRTPTLVVTAEDDMLVAASHAETLAGGIAGAALAVMARGGHACNVTDPEGFNRIVLGWLAGGTV